MNGDQMEKEEKIAKINRKTIFRQDIFMYFYIAAFLGWILETIFAFMVGNMEKRGFLYSPVCPIYGFGAILILLIHNEIKKKKIKNTFIIFVIYSVSFTILEYLSSVILEALFDMRWWDYTDLFMNFQGRIALAYSAAFGLVGIIFAKLIKNPLKRFLNRIRRKIGTNGMKILIIIFTITFITDVVFSCIRYA